MVSGVNKTLHRAVGANLVPVPLVIDRHQLDRQCIYQVVVHKVAEVGVLVLAVQVLDNALLFLAQLKLRSIDELQHHVSLE